MFGHDDNDGQKQDDQNGIGQVTTPTSVPPMADDAASLGDESSTNAAATAVNNTGSSGFIMDPVDHPTADPAAQQAASTAASATAGDDLITIKQEALQQLSPLVGHLQQSPEEKFRTLMMMIQASDDQTKLKEAYDVAKQIKEEKARAQALLDVVNEINYFTQQHKGSEQ